MTKVQEEKNELMNEIMDLIQGINIMVQETGIQDEWSLMFDIVKKECNKYTTTNYVLTLQNEEKTELCNTRKLVDVLLALANIRDLHFMYTKMIRGIERNKHIMLVSHEHKITELSGEINDLKTKLMTNNVFPPRHTIEHYIKTNDVVNCLYYWDVLNKSFQKGLIQPHAIDAGVINKAEMLNAEAIDSCSILWMDLKKRLINKYLTAIQFAMVYEANNQI